ncbi:MAG: Arc family DNA-binding protein [Lachnospiraceae bacterium]|nr:Arc family DNA-binding protein [Lachnospiraceae bacterium]
MFRVKKEYSDFENKSLRLPQIMIEKLQKLANENSLSFNKIVIQCIEYALDNMEDDSEQQK